MATAMLTERGVRRKMAQEERKKAAKRKPPPPAAAKRAEQNNNVKRQRPDNKDDMLATYQPWVIQTYGDLAKTKTITLKKYARILRTLRGEEIVSADNSKFRFWVKAKGFHVGRPAGYEPKPADAIVGRYSVCDADEGIPAVNDKLAGSAKDPPLYVPNAPFKVCTVSSRSNDPPGPLLLGPDFRQSSDRKTQNVVCTIFINNFNTSLHSQKLAALRRHYRKISDNFFTTRNV
jgi:hypothetical protein